jgi:hypothetical protein
MSWVEYIERVEDMRNAYKVMVGIPERKRPLRRHRRIWEYNIRMYIQEMDC